MTFENKHRIFIGQAGWALSKTAADQFPPAGTHLQRYATKLSAVEINSSFYRPHKPKTYERWAASVPADFRFAVKIPKRITHETRLQDRTRLKEFLDEIAPLGAKCGPLLVQLPPSLAFDEKVASAFFNDLRRFSAADIVCEPRHKTWFQPDVERLLEKLQVARAAADPSRGFPDADQPGGRTDLAYFRLHGSPRIYYSNYTDDCLAALSAKLNGTSSWQKVWCIFDNTALGFALLNALQLQHLQSQ